MTVSTETRLLSFIKDADVSLLDDVLVEGAEIMSRDERWKHLNRVFRQFYYVRAGSLQPGIEELAKVLNREPITVRTWLCRSKRPIPQDVLYKVCTYTKKLWEQAQLEDGRPVPRPAH